MKAVIFDLDGTLLDTLKDIANACNAALARHGFPTHPVNAYKYFVGDGVSVLMTRVLPPDGQEPATLKTLAATYQQEYERHWNLTTKAYAGIPELVSELARRQIKLAVLSNKPDDFTRRCVREFFEPENFSLVLGASEAFPRKPDPAAALHIASSLGVAPADVAYLGDTSTDMKTAVGASMLPFGVLWGFRTAEELRSSGARHLLSHPNELLQLV